MNDKDIQKIKLIKIKHKLQLLGRTQLKALKLTIKTAKIIQKQIDNLIDK